VFENLQIILTSDMAGSNGFFVAAFGTFLLVLGDSTFASGKFVVTSNFQQRDRSYFTHIRFVGIHGLLIETIDVKTQANDEGYAVDLTAFGKRRSINLRPAKGKNTLSQNSPEDL
jgi:hypothetical protein